MDCGASAKQLPHPSPRLHDAAFVPSLDDKKSSALHKISLCSVLGYFFAELFVVPPLVGRGFVQFPECAVETAAVRKSAEFPDLTMRQNSFLKQFFRMGNSDFPESPSYGAAHFSFVFVRQIIGR